MTKTALVTGSNTGIGFATAKGLAAAGVHVILGCRDLFKAEAAREQILKAHPKSQVDVLALDLANLMNIRSAIEVLKRRHPTLDILVNNAGVAPRHRQETRDGFEQTFGVNHLGTFALTQAALPLLKAAPAARIVTVSSALHKRGRMEWDDLHYRSRPFKAIEAYNQSKLANILFTKALARRLRGTNVTSFCLHPGVVATDLARDYPRWAAKIFGLFLLNPDNGARCSLFLATEPGLETQSGAYFGRCKAKQPAPSALVEEDQERLWRLSEELTS